MTDPKPNPAPNPTATPEMLALRRKARAAKDKIRLIVVQGRGIEADPAKAFLFKGMMKEIKSHYDNFTSSYDRLYDQHLAEGTHATFPNKEELEMNEDADRYYYESLAIAESLNSPPISAFNPTTMVMNPASRSLRPALPFIKLHKFDGEISKWPQFRDQFISLVHSDDLIPPVEKFHQLIGALEGVAYSMIKGIPITEQTYIQAWDTLNEHYNSKRILANFYLNKIFKCKPITGKPNVASLKRFITEVCENVEGYTNLKIPQSEEFLLFYIASRLLDDNTRLELEKSLADEEFPKFTSLFKFIKSECKTRELSGLPQDDSSSFHQQAQGNKVHHPNKGNNSSKKSFFAMDKQAKGNSGTLQKGNSDSTKLKSQSSNKSCPGCAGKLDHSIYRCLKFRAASAQEKRNLLSGANWSGCLNCLSQYHDIDSCKSDKTCRHCNQKHNSWLHIDTSNTSSTAAKPQGQANITSCNAVGLHSNLSIEECVMLGTVTALFRNSKGEYQEFRMVLDSGSQFSFITERAATKLGLEFERFHGSISGIGRVALDHNSPKGLVECTIRSKINNDANFSTQAVVLSRITSDLPQRPLPKSWRMKYEQFVLADALFWKPAPIDFLLGGDLFYDILEGKPIHVGANLPKVIPTVFGHVVCGRYQRPLNLKRKRGTALFASQNDELSQVLDKFWAVEEVEEKELVSPEDTYCENNFLRTYSRTSSGRYIVALPFREPPPDLSTSRSLAGVRFHHLENKFARDPDYKTAYAQFMNEYSQLHHMVVAEHPAAYTIPHHAVFKSDGVKSKIRVVFDASSKTSKGSLNDYLLPGPKLQKDIGMVLLRFRLHNIVFTTDIVKMFRQILVREEDLKYQHILWRSNSSEKLEDHELLTVTYGTTSAPWLAIRTLVQLAKDEGESYPEASSVLLNDTYVDDICTGAPSLQEALLLKQQLIALLKKGGFDLSKWSSNHPGFLTEDEQTAKQSTLQLSPKDETIKILGLQWDSSKDAFTYNLDVPSLTFTKRSILSTIARIFDPLGYVAPVICYAKIILQQCWQVRVDWDQDVPAPISDNWRKFVEQLNLIDQVSIPRHISTPSVERFEVVGFCDASESAYGALIYLRCVSSVGVQISLLKAKSKVAPLKQHTIPRLELLASLLLSRLYHSIKELFTTLPIATHYWFSDSTVVLSWLKTEPSALKTYVGCRVANIVSETSSNDWYHVRTDQNPADCLSRGLLPSEFVGHALWTTGPEWLQLDVSEWPIESPNEFPEEGKSEMRRQSSDRTALVATSLQPKSSFIPWMEKFSSFNKVVRIMAYVLRFIKNLVGWPVGSEKRKLFPKRDSALPELYDEVPRIVVYEYRAATKCLIKIVQAEYIISSLSSLIFAKLSPFIGEDGLARVGGRLENSRLPESAIHPILLPGKCHFTRLLIDYYHRNNFHMGPSALQSVLQCNYWIISARTVTRQRVHRCKICYEASKDPQVPKMGNLPSSRFQEGRSFRAVGVDLAGPFYIRDSLRRKAPVSKAYLCVFICMTSKGVHLEVVSNCSTPAFLAALDRFLSRRGLPERMHSDCGSNFIGANREMQELKEWFSQKATQDSIIEHLTPRSIEWSFNPPSAPHFGGLWEAAVKSTKSLFKRAVGETPLTFEELTTMFARIEAILNSRPLCPLNNDPENVECLTPGHLLIGSPLIARPELSLLELPENRLSRWQLVQQRTQLFWKRWRSEYLHHLQQRNKWVKDTPNIEKGDLVLVKEKHTPPTQWVMGRVQEVFPGNDGAVRVVELKTAKGHLVRPVAKLISLRPITDPDREESHTLHGNP